MNNPFFDRALKQAERLLSEQEVLSRWLDRAFEQLGRMTGGAYDLHDRSLALLRLLSAWSKGEYRGPSGKALLTLVAAVVYLVNPFDLVSDFIPVVGWLDDLAVWSWVLRTFRDEIEAFRQWESERAFRQTEPHRAA